MDRVVLQVPVDLSLRQKAGKVALEEGFSSLQEIVRVFLTQFAKHTFSFKFNDAKKLSGGINKRNDSHNGLRLQ